jgi:hypothetical protein
MRSIAKQLQPLRIVVYALALVAVVMVGQLLSRQTLTWANHGSVSSIGSQQSCVADCSTSSQSETVRIARQFNEAGTQIDMNPPSGLTMVAIVLVTIFYSFRFFITGVRSERNDRNAFLCSWKS